MGVDNSATWNILKIKEITSSATAEGLDDVKTTKVIYHRILSKVKKKHFITSSQVKHTQEEVVVSLSMCTIKRRFMNVNTEAS